MWLREGVGNVLGVLGLMFSFNSINPYKSGNGKWTGNEREMGNVLYILQGLTYG